MEARHSLYRALGHIRKGGLHEWARHHGWKGSDSDPIPEKFKKEASASKNPHVAHMGHLASTLEHLHHKG